MAPTKTTPDILTDVAGADRILAGYEAKARPILSRLADVAEEVRDRLVERYGDHEAGRLAAVKRLSTTVDPALLREANVLRMDLKQADDRTTRELDRWLAAARVEVAVAKADDPALATAAGRADRLAMVAEAHALAGRPLDELRAEGMRLAAQGDGRGAEVRLTACRLIGGLRVAQLRDLQAAVDAARDAQEPHRKAAAAVLKAATRSYLTARVAQTVAARIVTDLTQADPTRPDDVVARARARAATD